METDSVAAILGDHIFTGFGSRDAKVIDLPGKSHLIERLTDLAGKIQFEHHGGIGLVVVAFAVETSPAQHIVIQ